MSFSLILGAAFAVSLAGTWQYRQLALKRGIVAKPNARTLHASPIPRGAGVALGLTFALGAGVLWLVGLVPTSLLVAAGLGGGAATLIGFVDDLFEMSVSRKLIVQVALTVFLVTALYLSGVGQQLQSPNVVATFAIAAAALLVPLWLMNLFNFIDGIDGMAAMAAAMVGAGVAVVLFLSGIESPGVRIGMMLTAVSLGFLAFNLPPASVFMGEAGSLFLGYCVACLLLVTVASGHMSVWTWLTMLGYYVGDTTTTSTLRLMMIKDWWAGHRSHAYQNLARIRGHTPVTYCIALYQLLWALPLTVWSVRSPDLAILAVLLSIGPVVLWTLRFGPLFSKQ